MATGILWSVIIGLWAAYLVPLWIARHDTSRMDGEAGLEDADRPWSPRDLDDHAEERVAHDRYEGGDVEETGQDRTGRKPALAPSPPVSYTHLTLPTTPYV